MLRYENGMEKFKVNIMNIFEVRVYQFKRIREWVILVTFDHADQCTSVSPKKSYCQGLFDTSRKFAFAFFCQYEKNPLIYPYGILYALSWTYYY